MVPLVTILKVIYYFLQDDSQRSTLRTLNLRASLVSRICRRLQDVCSVDLQTRPIIPFGGPDAVVKCGEIKFSHKAKVKMQYDFFNFLDESCLSRMYPSAMVPKHEYSTVFIVYH